MLKKKRKFLPNPKKNNSFLFKLYDILNDSSNQNIILWKENTSILIKDRFKLTEKVLPKFFKHKNYSSFIRQLNLYGFYKFKGLIKDGELFQHDKLTKNSTKEQIGQIINQFKCKKYNLKYINNNEIKEEENDNVIKTNSIIDNNDKISKNIDNNLFKFLFEKNEENINNIIELKNEIINLKAQNTALLETIKILNNNILGHNILLEKIFLKRNNSDNNKDKKIHKSENIKELFKKYLYYLKIYSPYLILKKENNIFNKIQKTDSFKIFSLNDKFYNNINNVNNIHDINNNSNVFLNGYTLINQRQNMQNLILNLLNKNNSNSFLYGNNQNFITNIS